MHAYLPETAKLPFRTEVLRCVRQGRSVEEGWSDHCVVHWGGGNYKHLWACNWPLDMLAVFKV